MIETQYESNPEVDEEDIWNNFQRDDFPTLVKPTSKSTHLSKYNELKQLYLDSGLYDPRLINFNQISGKGKASIDHTNDEIKEVTRHTDPHKISCQVVINATSFN